MDCCTQWLMPAAPTKRKFGISELETLAVVWGIQHFHVYLYGHLAVAQPQWQAWKVVKEYLF